VSTSESSGYNLRSPQPIEIRVYDNDLRPVDRGVGSLKKDGLRPGLYRLELRAGASSFEKLIKLQSGQIYQDLNLQLMFSSVLPLPSTSTFDQAHLNALQALSVPGLILGQDAELVVFVRIVSGTPTSRPSVDIGSTKVELIDMHLSLVTGFGGASKANAQEGWYGVSAKVAAGGYLLRIVSGPKSVDQVLFLSKGWQTLVCVPFDDGGPRPEASSVQMLPMGQGGFLPTLELNQELALALEVATTGLAAGRSLVPRQQIQELLNRKFWNPMLGIIGAYCMFDPLVLQNSSPNRAQSAVLFGLKSPDDATLLNTVITNLKGLLPDHPDVAALGELYREATGQPPAAFQSIVWPPMVSIGYKQLVNFDQEEGLAIAVDSLADRARSWTAPCGPWTAWPSDKTRDDQNDVFQAYNPQVSAIKWPGLGLKSAASALGIVSKYLDEVSKTEEQPKDAVLSQLSDEDLSSNTGLRASVVKLARQALMSTPSSTIEDLRGSIAFDNKKEESSS
jgi:hypothetical protein